MEPLPPSEALPVAKRRDRRRIVSERGRTGRTTVPSGIEGIGDEKSRCSFLGSGTAGAVAGSVVMIAPKEINSSASLAMAAAWRRAGRQS